MFFSVIISPPHGYIKTIAEISKLVHPIFARGAGRNCGPKSRELPADKTLSIRVQNDQTTADCFKRSRHLSLLDMFIVR